MTQGKSDWTGRNRLLPALSIKPKPAFPARMGVQPVSAESKTAASFPSIPNAIKSFDVPVSLGLDSSAVRHAMVRRLSEQGIRHGDVLQAMGRVERHRFVDSALATQAYQDTSLPIGLGQTISKPSVVARMLELLVQSSSVPLGRVLEVGTGCGYQAAVLSQLCTEVYSMERLRGMHDKARELLRPFRIANLHLMLGDGMHGFASGAPYAGIIAAAGGEAVPTAWTDQLAVGGRLVAPVQWEGGAQKLVVIDKTVTGLAQTVLETVQFVPLKSGLG
jgi:protein-L-isoaspartate(D-aspartate) O-methyltransferase